MKIKKLNVKVDGKTISGSKKEIALHLRKLDPAHYTMAEIGKLTGCSRAYISFILRGSGFSKRFIRPKKIKIELKKIITTATIVQRRQKNLVRILFSDLYVPGDKFPFYLQDLILKSKMTLSQAEILEKFYFQGLRDLNNTTRTYRSRILKKIKVLINLEGVTYTKLIKDKYIKRK